MWEQCRLTGDTQPLQEPPTARVGEELGSDICVSGRAAGEPGGSVAVVHSKLATRQTPFGERSPHLHPVGGCGEVGLLLLHLASVRMRSGSGELQAPPAFGIAGFAALLE